MWSSRLFYFKSLFSLLCLGWGLFEEVKWKTGMMENGKMDCWGNGVFGKWVNGVYGILKYFSSFSTLTLASTLTSTLASASASAFHINSRFQFYIIPIIQYSIAPSLHS
jgi:hypothetical protein